MGAAPCHKEKSAIHEDNGLTVGEQKNAIQNCNNPLLKEFRDLMVKFRRFR